MLKWPRVMISIGLLVGQGLLLETPALAKTLSTQGVYIASEQVLAVPSQNGNSLHAFLTVNVHNTLGQRQDVTFNLPAGGENPRLVASSVKMIGMNTKAQIVMPVPARGVGTFAVEFSSPLNQNGTTLTWQENLPVQRLFFIIPEGALTVSAQGGFQTDSASLVSGGKAYREFTKLGIQAGTPWPVSVALLPTADGRQAPLLHNVNILNSYNQQTADGEAILNLVLVLLILGIGIISIRTEGKNRTFTELRELLKQTKNVLEDWADLEEAHACGEIDQSDYFGKRERFKHRVIELELAYQQRSSS